MIMNNDRLHKMISEQIAPETTTDIDARKIKSLQRYGDKKQINGFDLDGVITAGLYPGPNDVIITGRSYCMAEETYAMLHLKGIDNPVYFNPEHRIDSTRKSSGHWKAKILNMFPEVKTFFEDDPIQAKIIEAETNVEVVYVISDQEK